MESTKCRRVVDLLNRSRYLSVNDVFHTSTAKSALDYYTPLSRTQCYDDTAHVCCSFHSICDDSSYLGDEQRPRIIKHNTGSVGGVGWFEEKVPRTADQSSTPAHCTDGIPAFLLKSQTP